MFQKRTTPETRDSFGSVMDVWEDDFEEWAAFELVGSRLFPVSHRRFVEATARFRIRYVPGRVIDPKQHRIVLNLDPLADRQTVWTIFEMAPANVGGLECQIEAREFA